MTATSCARCTKPAASFQTAFVVFAVNGHVEEGELHLADEEQASLEVFGSEHFVEEFFRQGGAGFFVVGHLCQDVVFPDEVFHKLAGQLDGVPLDAVDAGYAQFVHLGEQVVQAVAGSWKRVRISSWLRRASLPPTGGVKLQTR